MATDKRIALVVAYPSTDSKTGDPIKFNMDYYTSTHMALISKVWGPHGMISYQINTFANPDPVTTLAPPYGVIATVYWPSLDAVKAALADKGSEVTGADVARFSNVYPAIWTAETGKSGEREEIERVGKSFVYGEAGL